MTRAAILLLVIVAVAPAASAQDGAGSRGTNPVSAGRVSEGLRRPELEIPPVAVDERPTFKTNVEGAWPIETNLQFVRRELAEAAGSYHQIVPGVGMTPPLVSVDVLPAIVGAFKHIRDARYASSLEDARERVAEDLAAFCTEHDCTEQAPPATEGVVVR